MCLDLYSVMGRLGMFLFIVGAKHKQSGKDESFEGTKSRGVTAFNKNYKMFKMLAVLYIFLKLLAKPVLF
jgi:hypothetical protein